MTGEDKIKEFFELSDQVWLRGPYTKVIGVFNNHAGEQFVVYHWSPNAQEFYLTGDALNWEQSWLIDGRRLIKQYAMEEDEQEAVANLLNDYSITQKHIDLG